MRSSKALVESHIWHSKVVGSHVRVDVEILVFQHGSSELHHLSKYEEVCKVMGDLFRNELNEIWHKLV